MRLRSISPIDGSVYAERVAATDAELATVLEQSRASQREWRQVPLAARAELCGRFVDAMLNDTVGIAEEITRQMGRPIAQSPGELRGFEERARYMIAIAEEALQTVTTQPRPGFQRYIQRRPLGVVLCLAPWNYPLLTAVNAVVPALMAGNSVVLKHSTQTPRAAERFSEAMEAAGGPKHLLQYVHCSHPQVAKLVAGEGIDYVCFTGSVSGGRAVNQAAAARFVGVGLELGGKDPAYVCSDAELDGAVESLVDGSFFNSGQSCCGVERIYVHRDVYDPFVEAFVELTRSYRLGNPLDPATNLGPLVKVAAADLVREQIQEALSLGARAALNESAFPASQQGSAYLAPQVLLDVDQGMAVMKEESFGPVVGIERVESDAEAVAKMNDCRYGLTASVWTKDLERAQLLGEQVEAGTWFMNRCDYLDPELAWTGVKDSGRGCTLSKIGYEALTRPKSFHLRTQ